mmetsp:Transcript_2759/g.11804  ORF Transcript_2759/g.11804 Transcript_2759/m.11804 type:complete len:485 (+) Transcript_2759:1354-2808(+)
MGEGRRVRGWRRGRGARPRSEIRGSTRRRGGGGGGFARRRSGGRRSHDATAVTRTRRRVRGGRQRDREGPRAARGRAHRRGAVHAEGGGGARGEGGIGRGAIARGVQAREGGGGARGGPALGARRSASRRSGCRSGRGLWKGFGSERGFRRRRRASHAETSAVPVSDARPRHVARRHRGGEDGGSRDPPRAARVCQTGGGGGVGASGELGENRVQQGRGSSVVAPRGGAAASRGEGQAGNDERRGVRADAEDAAAAGRGDGEGRRERGCRSGGAGARSREGGAGGLTKGTRRGAAAAAEGARPAGGDLGHGQARRRVEPGRRGRGPARVGASEGFVAAGECGGSSRRAGQNRIPVERPRRRRRRSPPTTTSGRVSKKGSTYPRTRATASGAACVAWTVPSSPTPSPAPGARLDPPPNRASTRSSAVAAIEPRKSRRGARLGRRRRRRRNRRNRRGGRRSRRRRSWRWTRGTGATRGWRARRRGA